MGGHDAESAIAGAVASLEQQATYPDTTRGPLLLRTCWVLTGLASVVFAGRIYVKARVTRRLYWDDVLMLGALLNGIAYTVLITIAVSHGLGRHLVYLSTMQREWALRIGFASLGPAFMSPMLGRVAFCVTMLYLTGTDPRVKKWPIWGFITLQILVNCSAVALLYLQCGTHLDDLWDGTREALYFTQCMSAKDQTDYGYFQGTFNTLTDLFLTALPALLIEHTRLSAKNKIGLAFLLCLSVLAMIASIVKTIMAKALSEVIDYTHDLSPYVIWLAVELNVVIIVSSIPLLRSLFRRKQQHAEVHPMHRWDTTTVGSILLKRGAKSSLSRVDSEENIIQQDDHFPSRYGQLDPGIVVTREVSITYETSNYPFVHAALVGLVQGEIGNPKLVRR